MSESDDVLENFRLAQELGAQKLRESLAALPATKDCGHGHQAKLDLEASMRACHAIWHCGSCAERRKKARFERAQQEAGIPVDVRHATLRNFQIERPGVVGVYDSPEKFLRAACAVARRQAWLTVFMGDVGIGKGHLAAALCNLRLKDGYTAKFWRVDALIDAVMQSYAKESAVRTVDIIRPCLEADLLVLDEAALSPMNNTCEKVLYEIVETRRQEERQIVITTNQPWQSSNQAVAMGFTNWWGSRTLSRLNDLQNRPPVWVFGRWADMRRSRDDEAGTPKQLNVPAAGQQSGGEKTKPKENTNEPAQ